MIFLAATSNKDKIIEFHRILGHLGIEFKTAEELGIELPEVEENGTTFAENALLKARSGAEVSGYPTLADDSGICVDALGGAPGIYSARYSGPEGDSRGDKNAANNAKLLRELGDLPLEKRTAHYTCAIACVFPDGRELVTEGYCFGHIGFEERGTNGFGYDPLVLINPEARATEGAAPGELTFGEIPSDVKDTMSHRSRALEKMCELLRSEL